MSVSDTQNRRQKKRTNSSSLETEIELKNKSPNSAAPLPAEHIRKDESGY